MPPALALAFSSAETCAPAPVSQTGDVPPGKGQLVKKKKKNPWNLSRAKITVCRAKTRPSLLFLLQIPQYVRTNIVQYPCGQRDAFST